VTVSSLDGQSSGGADDAAELVAPLSGRRPVAGGRPARPGRAVLHGIHSAQRAANAGCATLSSFSSLADATPAEYDRATSRTASAAIFGQFKCGVKEHADSAGDVRCVQ